MNYVDDSNYLDYLWEQIMDGNYRAFEVQLVVLVVGCGVLPCWLC